MSAITTTDREIISTRTFNAPRDLVFEVWTNPRHVVNWWGPAGFTNTIHEMEVKPGGIWRFIMHGPDGTDYPNKIVFREVVPPRLLSFDHGWDVADLKSDPYTFEVTVTFDAIGNTTVITMKMVFKTKAVKDEVVGKFGVIEGNRQMMEKLDAYLKNM